MASLHRPVLLQSGPERALIEGAVLDGWLKGPSYATGFDSARLQQLMERMQQQRKPDTAGELTRMHERVVGGLNCRATAYHIWYAHAHLAGYSNKLTAC